MHTNKINKANQKKKDTKHFYWFLLYVKKANKTKEQEQTKINKNKMQPKYQVPSKRRTKFSCGKPKSSRTQETQLSVKKAEILISQPQISRLGTKNTKQLEIDWKLMFLVRQNLL